MKDRGLSAPVLFCGDPRRWEPAGHPPASALYSGSMSPLNEPGLLRAVRRLAANDADLASVVAAHGPPPLWARPPGFATLLYIILEQQVSLASARAAYANLGGHLGRITPRSFLTVEDATLKRIGFSRQKARYGRLLAEAVATRRLRLADVHRAEDEEARSMLLELKGIGPWTADVYLLMALRRPDVWPRGDIALEQALREIKRLPQRPDPAMFEKLGRPWRPYRAAAARILWHHYLSTPRTKGAQTASRQAT